MHDGLAALGIFFDPLSVAAALRDAVAARTPEMTADETLSAMRTSSPDAVDDHDMLRRLLPQELYGFWRDAGYAGIYSMTFLLRHAVTFLALVAHEKVCLPHLDECRSGLAAFLKRHFPGQYDTADQGCLEALCFFSPHTQPGKKLYFPVIGFSSLGVHLLYREIGMCRAFDFYDIGCCSKRAEDGLFCPEHTAEAWWCDGGHKVSTQAAMFRFYGAKENIHQYDEHQLQELVGRFWTHFKQTKHLPHQGEGIVEEALVFFKYASLHECCEGGQLHLRRLYMQRARALHPDAGGEHASFVQLQKYYEVLRTSIQYELAGLF